MPGKPHRPRRTIVIGVLATACMLSASIAASAQGYARYNYVSCPKVPSQHALWQDANLVMPWGIAFSPKGPVWISNVGSGTSTVYYGSALGLPFPSQKNAFVVTVPPGAASAADAKGSPTGIAFNSTTDFVVSQNGASGRALFIFATRDGTISAWSPTASFTSAVIVVDNSAAGDIYTGLALGSNSTGNFLFVANAAGGDIKVFDKNFAFTKLAGSFTDPNLPAGFVPFNIQNIAGMLYVTYTSFHSDGLVNIFDTEGNFVTRIASSPALNLPWGLALAPPNFGQFSNDLLVGNLGDGRISAFDPNSGAFMGQLADGRGNPIAIKNLSAIAFGNGKLSGRTTDLLFIAASDRGVFGSIRALRP